MRNRAEGWQYAKLTGHTNEENLKNQLNKDQRLFNEVTSRIALDGNLTGHVSIGGLTEKNVPSILGNTTKSKTDMKIMIANHPPINVSIKKSLGGQVYLIKTSRFIEGFQAQFHKEIPEEVKKSMLLFWGEDPDIDHIILEYGEKDNDKIAAYEQRKHRLVSTSLYRFDPGLYKALIGWFHENISTIAGFCFSSGLAKHKAEWAEFVWYKNSVGDNEVDDIFDINDICTSSYENNDNIEYGSTGGGTTIQLPFGFVQWHQGQMQFHHSHEKISAICKKM